MCENNTECSLDGIARICYKEPKFSSETFFCDCSSWFGFVGENCDEASVTVYYLRGSTLFFLALFIVLSCFITRTICVYIRSYRKGERKGNELEPVFYLLLFILLASLLLLVQAAVRIPTLFDPSLYIVDIQRSFFFDDQDEVLSTTGEAGAQIILAGSCLIFLAEIQVILSWLRVLITFSHVFPESYGCISMERLAQIFKYILPFLLLCIALLFSIDFFSESALFYMLLVVVLTVGYMYGYYRFVRLLEEIPKEGKAKMKAIHLVKTTYQITLFANLGVFIFSALYYVFLVDYLNQLAPGQFNYIIVLFDLALLSASVLLWNLSWYAHIVTVRMLNIESKAPWVPTLGLRKLTASFGSFTKTRNYSLDNQVETPENQPNEELPESI